MPLLLLNNKKIIYSQSDPDLKQYILLNQLQAPDEKVSTDFTFW